MYSINNIINSDTTQIPERVPSKFAFNTDSFSIKRNYSGEAALLDTTITAKYLGVLRTRLSFAKYKIENQWEDKSFTEILQLHNKRSGFNFDLSHLSTEESFPYIISTSSVSLRQKRKYVEDSGSHTLLTPPRAWMTEEYQKDASFQKNALSTDPLGKHQCQYQCQRSIPPLSNIKPLEHGDELGKGKFSAYSDYFIGSTIPRPIAHGCTKFLQGPFEQISPPSWPIFRPIPRTDKLTGSHTHIHTHSPLPAFEAAEATISLCSPHSSTPGTSQLSPLEHSSLLSASPASKSSVRSHGVYTIPIDNGSYEFISVNTYSTI